MIRVLANPDSYAGKAYSNAKGNTECVEFVKQTLAAPVTALWREGLKVKKLNVGERDPLSRGTAIATFVDGKYPQTGITGMHAAIYLGQNADGIQVLDQWRSQGKVLARTIPWKPRRPGLSNSASTFSAIEW
ncbi:BPSL0067 family protein [Nevskia sp.]|uniref:BPSL0067 family protein n=1 Tax=Nevskia sp. TaxID=1929292 RepID=UPI0025F05BEE|nr:BPSL0067 family protein [Nevskia sp.]